LPSFRPHIIILDLLMPEVDGWQLVQQVQLREGFEQLQFITVSALSDEDLKLRGGPPEGSQFMAKPIDLGWLQGYLLGLMRPQAWV